MPSVAPQVNQMSKNEKAIVSLSMMGKLADGELLTGSPTVSEVDTNHLNITNPQISTVELVINGETVPIGGAILITVDATGNDVVDGEKYEVLMVCATTLGNIRDGIATIEIT